MGKHTPPPPTGGPLGHPREFRFDIPLPPPLTNSGVGRSRHWRALEREKKRYWASLDNLALLRRIPRAPDAPMEHAEAGATMYLWNEMDDGNAIARLKWLEDWLVRRGYLRDDRRKNLRWKGLPHQVVVRGEHGRVVLTLVEVPP